MSRKIPIVDTKININDYSNVKDPVTLVSTIPLYLIAFSSDKGPEDLMEISNSDRFFKLFVGDRKDVSHKRHGQPLLQAASSVDAGARLLCKRVVAPDASLANITVFAETRIRPRLIIKTKEDASGRTKLVFEDPTKPSSEENEYLWDGEGKFIPKRIPDPQKRNSVLIRYFTVTDKGIKDINTLKHKYENYQSDGHVFPLFTITDNGRGVSKKSVRIDPAYYGRSMSTYQRHTISVIEKNNIVESIDFTFNPDIVINGVNKGMNATVNRYMEQIKCHQYETFVEKLYDYVLENTIEEGVDRDEYLEYLKSIDFLFGKSKRNYIEQIQIVESESSPLNDLFGNPKDEGTSTVTPEPKPSAPSTSTDSSSQTEPQKDPNVEALKNVQAQLDSVNEQLAQSKKELDAAKAENQRLQNENATGNQQKSEAEAQLSAKVTELENTKRTLEETRNSLRQAQEAKIAADAAKADAENDAKAKAEELARIQEELNNVNAALENEKSQDAAKAAENQKKLEAAKARVAELERQQAEAEQKEKEAEAQRLKNNRDNLTLSIAAAKEFMTHDEYTKHVDDKVKHDFDAAYAKAVEIEADTIRPYSSTLIAFVNSDLLSKQSLVLTTYVAPAEKPPKADGEEAKNKEAATKELAATLKEVEAFKTTSAYTAATPGPILDAFNTAFDEATAVNDGNHTSVEIKKANDKLKLTMGQLALAKNDVDPTATPEDTQALSAAIDAANVVKGSADYTESGEIAEKVEFEKSLNDAIALRDKPETSKAKVTGATSDLLAKTDSVKVAAKKAADEKRQSSAEHASLEDKKNALEKERTEVSTGAIDSHHDSVTPSHTEEAGHVERGAEPSAAFVQPSSISGPGPMVLMASAPADLEPTNPVPVKPDESRTVINLMTPSGVSLLSGDNGSFGNTPIGKLEYENELFKFFNGDITNEIYDQDNYKIDIVMDANYPIAVKNVIEEYVTTYRNDCVYFRDYGLGMNSMQEIEQMWSGFNHHYTVADYYLSYDIIDPYTNKQVPVTMTYTMAKKMVKHYKNGRHRPCAGIPYGFILEDAIPGTESFVPTRTKFVDQRERLSDKRINYAVYHDGQLVLETFYTSQDNYSQLSFIHNVLNIQRLVKIIRTKCPTIRYSFMDGRELQNYKEEITYTLNEESANFALLEVHFLMDETNMIDKQVHVVVEVACREFQQSELFDINVININDAKKKATMQ